MGAGPVWSICEQFPDCSCRACEGLVPSLPGRQLPRRLPGRTIGNSKRRVAERSFRNLPRVAITRSGQLAAYDVLWADTVLFTTDTLGSMAAGAYDVSDEDFIQESTEVDSVDGLEKEGEE